MRAISSRRAKACAIPASVKKAVWERDGQRSIFSGSPYAFPECHYISRANGGLGIEENLFTATREEHRRFDEGDPDEREMMRWHVERYMRDHYPDWNPKKLIYNKWAGYAHDR